MQVVLAWHDQGTDIMRHILTDRVLGRLYRNDVRCHVVQPHITITSGDGNQLIMMAPESLYKMRCSGEAAGRLTPIFGISIRPGVIT